MATEDDKVDTGALGTVVAVGAAGMIGISLAVNALVRHEVGVIGAGRDQLGEAAFRAHKDEQLKKLSASPSWTDQSKGQVSVPIERAMSQVLADLRRNPWNATPAAPPPDAGAADAAAEAAPDAGVDGAAATEPDAGSAAPEPPASARLTPTTPAPTGSAPAAPKPASPRALPPPTVPPAPPPPASAPAQPAPPAPAATKP